MSVTLACVVHKYLCHRVSIFKFVNLRHKNQAYYSDLVNSKITLYQKTELNKGTSPQIFRLGLF